MKLQHVLISLLLVWFQCRSAYAADSAAIGIGIIVPLSGVRGDAGRFVQNGIRLAQDALEKESNPLSIRILFEDSRYEPKEALASYNKLHSIDGVRYFIGPYGTSEVLAVAPVSERDGSILVLPGAMADEISDAGERIFRLSHNCRQEAPFLADIVAERMEGASLGAISITTAFSPSYLRYFTPRFEQHGKKLVQHEEFDASTTDFRPQLMKLKEAGLKDVLMLATPLQAGLIMKQGKQYGFRPQWYNIGVESRETISAGGEAAEGMIYPYSYDSESSFEPLAEFARRYRARFNEEPDMLAANGYDALMLLVKCLGAVGDDSGRVTECLYQTAEYPGAGGRFTVDRRGDVK